MSENSNGGMGTPSNAAPWVFVVVALIGLIGTSLTAWFQYKEKVDVETKAAQRPDIRLSWPATYWWQGGEEGWLGQISINENGGADISATRYEVCNGKRQALNLLRQEGTGTATLRDN